MKIDYINKIILNDNKKFSLKRELKIGIAISLEGMFKNSEYDSSFIFPSGVIEEAINMSHESISFQGNHNLSLILNDNDCRDTLFQEVCDILREDGVVFSTTSKCEDINRDQSIVITLDQLYNSGDQSLIFAPYDNTRLGESDALVLAMHTAFGQNALAVSDVVCGKTGFRENEDGSISEIVPTEQEELIDPSADVSFVTISLGTKDTNARRVAESIENGLARFYYYLEKSDLGSDLIYRADTGEDLEIIADYFHTSLNELREMNDLGKEDKLVGAKAIINPHIKEMSSFSDNYIFKLDEVSKVH